MTSLRPGHRPPHVTIPARVLDGSKKILRRGPAGSKLGRSPTEPPRPRTILDVARARCSALALFGLAVGLVGLMLAPIRRTHCVVLVPHRPGRVPSRPRVATPGGGAVRRGTHIGSGEAG